MKVVINSSHQRFGGAVQVALSFIYECRKFPEHEYYIWVGPGLKKSLQEEDFSKNFHFDYFDFGVLNFRKTFLVNRILRAKEQKIQPDCIICTSGPSYFRSIAPQLIGFNLPLYIYPESPYLRRLTTTGKLKLSLKKLFHYYYFKRDADAYFTQTDDVNQRVRKALQTDKVYTVTNNHSSVYLNWQKYPSKLPKRQPTEIRLVTISAWYPHKNLEIIAAIVQQLRKRGITHLKFVLTIDKSSYQKAFGSLYRDEIITIGSIKPEECPSLYDECDIMFLPTLAECFSASYPEAMIMGKPIVTTDLGFAGSICGEGALYYPALDATAATDVILRLVNDPQLYARLQEKGKARLKMFDSPQERAEKYLQLAEKLIYAGKN
jgi:glycosyltransferase involved in cell wall biosynthesis